jgi:N-acetylmuramoyl-L-alanine amidase
MPNVLVELGYLSNRNEEQFLRSENGQSRVAEALFKGIKEYKINYEKSLQEGMDNK